MLQDLFYRQPRLTALVLCLIVLAGLTAVRSLPRQEDPALTGRFAGVITHMPGASAELVEVLITDKIETALREIEEIHRISSRSQTGLSVVRLQLEDRVTDVDAVWSRVSDKLADLQGALPAAATVPDFDPTTTAAYTLLVGFTWRSDGPVQLDLLHRFAKELEQRMVALPGTKEVELYGEPEDEILVRVDPAVLVAAGITTTRISSAIAGADPKTAAGRLRGQRADLIVELGGQLDSIDRIRDIPLRQGEDDHLLRVGDIARVEKVAREPPETMAIVHGERGIVLAAKIDDGLRVDRWAAAARNAIDDFRAALPDGVAAEIIFDQSVHTHERLSGLLENLLLGAALVVAVLLVMMGWKSALVAASALPLVVLTVLWLLNLLRVPLHQVSLTGLIIALGLLIDNAIITVDHYNRLRLDGADRGEAVRRTVGHLFVPLSASTITTALAFLPLVLMPGNAGEFVSTLGISVILAIVCSLVLSFTIVPTLAAWLDRPGMLRSRSGFAHIGYNNPALSSAYERLVEAALRRPWTGIAVALALPVSGFLVAPDLGQQFFPPVDRNQFQIQLMLPKQTSLEETAQNVRRADQILQSRPEVLDSTWFVGEQPPRAYYNVTIAEERATSFAAGFVNTRSPEATEALLSGLQREMVQAFPNGLVLTLPYQQGPPVEAPIELRVFGPDLESLQSLGEELRLVLSQTAQVTYTRATVGGGRPKLSLVPDEDQARLAGFDLIDLASELQANLDGITGGLVIEGTEELPVRVRLDAAARTTISQIAALPLLAPHASDAAGGEPLAAVPLNALAQAAVVPQLDLITRRNGERVNTIEAFVEPFTLPSRALADFRDRLDASGYRLPPGYRLEYGGETEGSGEARANLLSVLGPLAVLMVGTVVLAFNSFRMAAIIGMVAFLSIGGALLTLWTFSYPLGFMAIIGSMGLIGIAINDSIVVLSALRADPAARAGDLHAIRQVVVGSTRHILSTSITTIGGFAPLIVWGGTFWPPLVVAIAGGMIGATLLALFFVPPVFALMTRRGAGRRGDVLEFAAKEAKAA